ncbi:MAG: phosphonate C-P lyase system protein PhnG [Deltaproteobacteria bacterium]|nr:phosphonate C-P lyase system protein PhnG [Deltaproteobacteria bacterium]
MPETKSAADDVFDGPASGRQPAGRKPAAANGEPTRAVATETASAATSGPTSGQACETTAAEPPPAGLAEVGRRRRLMRIFALAGREPLAQGLEALEAAGGPHGPGLPPYEIVRGPERGLAMVRGRVGGEGALFNVGEMLLARCSVVLDGGDAGPTTGHGYVSSGDLGHALLAALADALGQTPAYARRVERLADRLELAGVESLKAQAAKTAKTKVNFLTMVRGEDQP